MELKEALAEVQKNLKAPKGEWNSFSKFAYRSAEGILEAVKPILNGLLLTLSDEVVAVGDRIYVKATAKLELNSETISAFGWAREAATKKGMDDSQITGTASSYARKYALNGLFLIDDTKDIDSMNNSGNAVPVKPQLPKGLIDMVSGVSSALASNDLQMVGDLFRSFKDIDEQLIVQKQFNSKDRAKIAKFMKSEEFMDNNPEKQVYSDGFDLTGLREYYGINS